MSFTEDAEGVRDALQVVSTARACLQEAQQSLKSAEENLDRKRTALFEKYPDLLPPVPVAVQPTVIEEQDDGSGPLPGPMEFRERS